MNTLSPRQRKILLLLSQKDLPRSEIEEILQDTYAVSKATTIRDLAELQENGYVRQNGAGPTTFYSLSKLPTDIPIIDVEEYFKLEPDQRLILGEKYNSKLMDLIPSLFSKEELTDFEKSRVALSTRISSKTSIEIKKELERFIIELSWKSSKIEGNTYTLLDTESLLKNNKPVPGYTTHETQMILNHKYAFDYVLSNLEEFETFSEKSLHTIHSLIVKDLDIQTGYRSKGVGISGTKYLPIDNKYQIEDEIKKLTKILSSGLSPVSVALGVLLFISYIQPFSDGNKRTARLLSNAILLANHLYPLSYRSVDEIYYKKALILFYEQFTFYYFKEIFKDQYLFSVKNYFLA